MRPFITTVITPAADPTLISLDDLREQLRIKSNDTANDAWLTKVIARCSKQAERYCNRIFTQQTYQDTFGMVSTDPGTPLMLGQAPVNVTLVSVDGSDLDASDFIADAEPGLLYNTVQPRAWVSTDAIVVTYSAGFATIPEDVQQAVLDLCTMDNSGRGRDPMLRASEMPGLGRQEFWVGGLPGGATIPEEIAGLLNPFRRGLIG